MLCASYMDCRANFGPSNGGEGGRHPKRAPHVAAAATAAMDQDQLEEEEDGAALIDFNSLLRSGGGSWMRTGTETGETELVVG